MKPAANTRTIIFDLGGVIIDLDIQASLVAMARLADVPVDRLKDFYHTDEFLAYETGRMSDLDFRNLVRQHSHSPVQDEQIDDAWNAMLLDLPAARMQLVTRLRSNHQLMVLSNTNGIHVRKFNQILEQNTGRDNLEHFFDVVYFSHLINMRKPDQEIYEFVLEQNGLKPEETLFLDDNKSNLESAANLGIQTLHITNPQQLFEIFEDGSD